MKLRDRVANWASFGRVAKLEKEVAKVTARYEAAFWNTNRSYIPGYIQSVRDDANTLSRQEIMRRIRAFEKNSNVLQKVLTVLDVNVIGTGITPTPATESPAWNKAALAWWNEWSKSADLSGLRTIPQCQSVTFRGQNLDGDHGLELGKTPSGRPAISLIEGHRVNSVGYDTNAIGRSGYAVFDGVMVEKTTGRPQAYIVSDDFDSSITRTIPASNFVLFSKKERAGQYRGISRFHAAILDLHDLDDLQRYEMLAAKDAASTSKVIQSAAGSAAVEGPSIGASLRPVTTTGPDGATKTTYYKQAIGAEVVQTYAGDKYEEFSTERPSAATTGFWDRLDNKIVQGAGISYAALVDYRGNWGGATLRAAVQSDNRIFELNTIDQSNGWQRVWDYAIGWAMSHGELPFNSQFREVRWHPPRRATVDIGNESSAMLAELQAGAKTFEDVYGEMGEDWKDRLTQRAEEEAFINDLATQFKVERQLISSFAQERLQGTAVDATAAAPGVATPPKK